MRAVFIDRDGTMGGEHTIEYPQDYRAVSRHGGGVRPC